MCYVKVVFKNVLSDHSEKANNFYKDMLLIYLILHDNVCVSWCVTSALKCIPPH